MRPAEARNRAWEDRPRLDRQERFFAAAEEAIRGEHVALLPLPRLLELKLASGMTAPHRLKDLADVLEVIRILKLPAALADELDPYVREKYRELWQAAQVEDRE